MEHPSNKTELEKHSKENSSNTNSNKSIKNGIGDDDSIYSYGSNINNGNNRMRKKRERKFINKKHLSNSNSNSLSNLGNSNSLSNLDNSSNKKISSRKVVNLPATQPYIKVFDGEEKMVFKYNTRMSESALSQVPKESVVDDEFKIYFSIENVDILTLNEKFKLDNCIYPRANVPLDRYAGNRWIYETECNKLAWQLVSLNSQLLYGKKGLIQRAVDSFRYLMKTSKGSKYFKDDLFSGDIERRKQITNSQQTSQLDYSFKNVQRKCKVYLGINHVDFNSIPDEFKNKYSVFPEEYDEFSFGLTNIDYRNTDNLLSIKIAYLNVENTTFQNCIKMIGVTAALKNAVNLFKIKREELEKLLQEEEKDVCDIVSDALDEALNDFDGNDKDFYFDIENVSVSNSNNFKGGSLLEKDDMIENDENKNNNNKHKIRNDGKIDNIINSHEEYYKNKQL